MQVSDTGLALTRKFEGLRIVAYRDCAGVLTVGYGHTGPDVRPGRTGTIAEAVALLRADMAHAEASVNALVKVPLTQPQFDALADFAFNEGVHAFQTSAILMWLNARDYVAAAQFADWVWAGGTVEPGLVARRKAETEMFMGGTG